MFWGFTSLKGTTELSLQADPPQEVSESGIVGQRVVDGFYLESGEHTGMRQVGFLEPGEGFVFIAHADVRQKNGARVHWPTPAELFQLLQLVLGPQPLARAAIDVRQVAPDQRPILDTTPFLDVGQRIAVQS